jgi:PTS system ascorbate-specific IIB component
MSEGDALRVLTVCGVGMGSSLMLRMTTEKALRELGVPATVEATDISSARGMTADVIIGQGMHTDELAGRAEIVLAVSNFMDTAALQAQLEAAFRQAGWIQ